MIQKIVAVTVRFQPRAEGIHKECPNKIHHRFLALPYMPGIFVFAAATWACSSWLFFPLNHLGANAAEARSMLCHPSSPTSWKALQRSRADVRINSSSIACWKAKMGDVPVEDRLSVDVIKVSRGGMRGKLAVAKPDLKAFVRDGIEHWGRVRVAHPKDLGEIIHLNILLSPEVQIGSSIIVLMALNMSSSPCDGAATIFLRSELSISKCGLAGSRGHVSNAKFRAESPSHPISMPPDLIPAHRQR
jgi:hypothetical protein